MKQTGRDREMYKVTPSKLSTWLTILYLISATGSYAVLTSGARHRTIHKSPAQLTEPEAVDLSSFSSNPQQEFSAHRIAPIVSSDNEPKSNGSLILDDLVNQFLEKNREAVQQVGDQQALDLEVRRAVHGTPVERSSGVLVPEGVENSSNAAATQVFGAENMGGHYDQPETDEELAAASAQMEQQHQQLSQDIADRHIQYDYVNQQQQQQQQMDSKPRIMKIYTNSNMVEDNKRHLSDYKLSSGDDTTNDLGTSTTNEPVESSKLKPEGNTTKTPTAASELMTSETTRNQEKITMSQHRQESRVGNSTGSETPVVTTVNTTNFIDVVAPSPLMGNTDQAQGSSGNASGRSMGSGGMVQARSMYSGPSMNSKTPGQHTRPPYATHDQFNHKSELGAASSQDVATSASRTTSSLNQQTFIKSQNNTAQQQHETQIGPSSNHQIVSTEPPVSHRNINQDQVPRQLVSNNGDRSYQNLAENDKLHKLTNTQMVELSPIPAGSNNAPSSRMPVDRDNQADRLQFAKENLLFAGSSQTPNRVAHNDRYSSSTSGSAVSQANGNGQEQKLYEQPANTFSDLSSGGFYLTGKNFVQPEHQHQVVERDSKDEANGNENSRKMILNLNDLMSKVSTNTYISNPDQHSGSGSSSNRYQQQLDLSSEGQQRQQPSNNNNNEHDISSSNSNSNIRSHQSTEHLASPSASGALLVLHRNPPPPTHYAASLVNVTAPMVLPLSASEAMESALGGGQAAKTLLNQVSGLLRPSPQQQQLNLDSTSGSSSSTASGGNRQPQLGQTTQQRQAQQSHQQQQQQQQQTPLPQYYMPGFSGSEPAIYSQPANQFSPPKQLQQQNQMSTLDNNDQTTNSTSNMDKERMRLDGSGYIIGSLQNRRPSYQLAQQLSAINVTQPQHQASGFRSPSNPHGHLSTLSTTNSGNAWATASLSMPSSYLSGSLNLPAVAAAAAVAAAPPQPSASGQLPVTSAPGIQQQQQNGSTTQQLQLQMQQQQMQTRPPAIQTLQQSTMTNQQNSNASIATSTTNGFITGATSGSTGGTTNGALIPADAAGSTSGLNRRVFNLTRVEHISAECSNDLIRTVIVFNGTFKGIIYSSGYVRDPNCLYINGTGKTRYDFSIRLNQCGTLGRQELHPPVGPNEVRRRDQVMWNTLSIQYNPIIEQEWDEHFRVSCEYGSDFWKTVSFSPFNVETNTGAPVVFTVDPPQCQMEILRGHGMVGPRQEAVSGPVTVGDPLTLLIHMKSEKAGYDILVKNCIAHNGGHQKMQLIDSNGCVVNERFISPFRGTYNDNDLKHVTLYSYLKAFRFTGSPVLYLECEIHMCQSSCPPQMCYWRRLSKRSANESNSIGDDFNSLGQATILDDESPATTTVTTTTAMYQPDATTEATLTTTTIKPQAGQNSRRKGRHMRASDSSNPQTTPAPTAGQISDKVSLFQALEVRQERSPDASPYSLPNGAHNHEQQASSTMNGGNGEQSGSGWPLMCYRRAEVLAFLFTAISLLLVALSVTVGCCWRAASLRVQDRRRLALVTAANISSANSSPISPPLSCGGSSYISNSSSTSSSSRSCGSGITGNVVSPGNNTNAVSRMSQHQAQTNYAQSSGSYRRALNAVGPILVQHHSKQRHKECLLSANY